MTSITDNRPRASRSSPLSIQEAAAPLLGVVDVGSNSIRLVVYDASSRSPTLRFNEKVLCGLGRGLADTGALNPQAVETALATLKRFAALAQGMGASAIHVVATAAVRDASNGPAFMADVERAAGIKIRILSGADEAHFSALGVLSGVPGAHGLMGDLGGGSLELVGLADGRSASDAVTLPLGPLRLMGLGEEKSRAVIDQAYEGVPWLRRYSGKPLYIVGGAWRTLARIHMTFANYPLHIIHHYSLKPGEVEDLTRLLAKQSKESLARIPGLSRRRLEVLPLAAAVLRRLVKVLQPGALIFSAYGLREGLLYDHLPDALRRQDPLLAAAERILQRDGRFPGQINHIHDFIAPLFIDERDEDKRLRHAAVLLSDIAWEIHPDYRAEQAFTHVLHAPFAAVTHGERIRLSLALYARYAGDLDHPMLKPFMGLVGEGGVKWALRLGLALRLAQNISGGAGKLLTGIKLQDGDKELRLVVASTAANLMGEVVERRLASLAKVMGRTPHIHLG